MNFAGLGLIICSIEIFPMMEWARAHMCVCQYVSGFAYILGTKCPCKHNKILNQIIIPNQEKKVKKKVKQKKKHLYDLLVLFLFIYCIIVSTKTQQFSTSLFLEHIRMISEGSCDTDLKAGVMMLEIQLCITGINCIEHILKQKTVIFNYKIFHIITVLLYFDHKCSLWELWRFI